MSTTPPIEDFEVHMPDDLDVAHCYRHPDRETGVRCANCGRPICHECMTPAAVGFRCPDCMAEQRRGAGRPQVVTRQQTRNRWQGSAMMGGRSGLTVTKALIAINVAMFLVETATHATSNLNELVRLGGLVPSYVIERHEYWRMFASMFLHESFWHILINMVALWFLGEYTEAVLGRVKFLVLYLVTGLAGSTLVVLYAAPFSLTVGASGAIAGAFGALMAYAYLNRHRDYVARAIFGQLVFWFILNLVINLYSVAQPGGGGGLSWEGHLGGFVSGIVLMAAYTLLGRKSPYGRFTAGDVVATVVVLGVLVALVYWRVQSATVGAFIPWL